MLVHAFDGDICGERGGRRSDLSSTDGKDIGSNKTYPDNEIVILIQSSEYDLCLPHTYTGTQGMFNEYAWLFFLVC